MTQDRFQCQDRHDNELEVFEAPVFQGEPTVTISLTGPEEIELVAQSGVAHLHITPTPEQTRALFRYLSGLVLPKVEREDDHSPFTGRIIHWKVGGIVYVSKDRYDTISSVTVDDVEELANLLACLLAAADEAEVGR